MKDLDIFLEEKFKKYNYKIMTSEINFYKKAESEKMLRMQMEQIESVEERLENIETRILPKLTNIDKQISELIVSTNKMLDYFNLS